METRFHHRDTRVTLKHRKELQAFVPKLFRREKTACEAIDIIFCTDEFLLEMNKNFLQHNYYTDIITFNLAPSGSPILGELYISVDRVRDNAQVLRVSFKSEIHRVIFHGILHLCGYGDKSQKDQALIRKMEDLYINEYLSAN